MTATHVAGSHLFVWPADHFFGMISGWLRVRSVALGIAPASSKVRGTGQKCAKIWREIWKNRGNFGKISENFGNSQKIWRNLAGILGKSQRDFSLRNARGSYSPGNGAGQLKSAREFGQNFERDRIGKSRNLADRIGKMGSSHTFLARGPQMWQKRADSREFQKFGGNLGRIWAEFGQNLGRILSGIGSATLAPDRGGRNSRSGTSREIGADRAQKWDQKISEISREISFFNLVRR